MKLILLPGMDGTGEMFSPLLLSLEKMDVQVIQLPQFGDQSYPTLTEFVKAELPNEDFILIAESFSGPIAVKLAQENIGNMKGVIFVATFISPPNAVLLHLAKILPLARLSKMPLSKYVIRFLFFGSSASNDIVGLFQKTVEGLSYNIINARIRAIQSLTMGDLSSELPSVYIMASSDKLVFREKGEEFIGHFKAISLKEANAPHFVLQVRPRECARIIRGFINDIEHEAGSRLT